MPVSKARGGAKSARTIGASRSAAAEPLRISPHEIRKNPYNPRIDFPQSSLERLAESIESVGVLVPVTVYQDSPVDGTRYVLLDGERRWRAAKTINLETVPAWVIPKPDGADNALRMFNIHMLREDWSEMATAWALKRVMDETKKTDENQLSRLTGLSRDRLRNMKRVLEFPLAWQKKVEDGLVPFNLLVELDKAVLSKSKAVSELLAQPVRKNKIRDVFLQKYEDKVIADVVDLRKVGALIQTAHQKGTAGERAKAAFVSLVQDPKKTVEEAYEEGGAKSLEVPRVLRDISGLPDRLRAIVESKPDRRAREQLRKALRLLRAQLVEILKAI